MMTNIFTIFDPVVPFFTLLNWSVIFLPLLIPISMYMISMNYYSLLTMSLFNYLFKEFKPILKKNPNFLLFIITILIFIFINNITSNFPYVFPSTSHISVSVSLSLTFWLTIMIFSMTKNLNSLLLHMVPTKTPYLLTPFMVMIETMSLLIRPLTLALRLTINMLAGHLLLSLASEAYISNSFLLMSVVQNFLNPLLFLELSVSFIQSYVFTILISLYLKESNM